MAQKKQYRIYCVTEGANVHGTSIADEPPDQCPNNASHTVNVDSKVIEQLIAIDNLTATTDPTSDDDINDGYVVGSRWVNTNTSDEFSCANNAANSAVWIKTRKDVFGTSFVYAQSLGLSTTTSESYQNKVILELGTTTAGVYACGFHYEASVSKGNYAWRGRVIIDDSTIIHNNYNWCPWFSDAIQGFGGVIIFTLTAASHHVDIEWCTSNSGQMAAGIRNANLAVWRVS